MDGGANDTQTMVTFSSTWLDSEIPTLVTCPAVAASVKISEPALGERLAARALERVREGHTLKNVKAALRVDQV